jgi:hypothetical protein
MTEHRARPGRKGRTVGRPHGDVLGQPVLRDQTRADAAGAIRVPTGVAVFREDLDIRRYGEWMHNIVHWSEFETGGHLAAMETPTLLVNHIPKLFSTLT